MESPSGPSTETSTPSATPTTDSTVRGGASHAKGRRPPIRRSGFSLRNAILFGGLVVLLLVAFGVVGTRNAPGPAGGPRWKMKEPVDVEVTLVASDANDLSCAMESDVAGLHCAFTAPNAKNASAKGPRDDDKLLQPYATTNRINFLASGLWMSPDLKDAAALAGRMRDQRFAVACKFTPLGQAKGAKVQWKPGSDWGPAEAWYVGELTDCKLPK